MQVRRCGASSRCWLSAILCNARRNERIWWLVIYGVLGRRGGNPRSAKRTTEERSHERGAPPVERPRARSRSMAAPPPYRYNETRCIGRHHAPPRRFTRRGYMAGSAYASDTPGTKSRRHQRSASARRAAGRLKRHKFCRRLHEIEVVRGDDENGDRHHSRRPPPMRSANVLCAARFLPYRASADPRRATRVRFFR